MNVVFFVDGGAGRVIAAIPALEKYVLKNPNNNVSIIISGWDRLFLSNPILQNITYPIETHGLFQNVLKHADLVISPEPYRVPDYYNQKCSMAKAFDILINGENTVDDKPNLYTSKLEKMQAKDLLRKIKSEKKKNKTIVIQPFGRSATKIETVNGNKLIVDPSSRGLDSKTYLKIVKKLSLKYNLVLFAEKDYHLPEDAYTVKPEIPDLRSWLAIIEECDYFVGVDSLGQHIARAFDKRGTFIAGSTFPINVSYPDWFNVFEKENIKRMHNAIRLTPKDSELGDRYNETCLDLTDEEIEKLIESIIMHIEKE